MPRNWKHPPLTDAEFAALSPEEKAARTGRMSPEERAEKRANEWGPAREAREAERGGLSVRGHAKLKKVPDIVKQAVTQISWDSRVFVTLVGRSVPYSAYAGQEPPLSVEMHRRLIGLALLDLFTEDDEDTKARNLSTGETIITTEHLRRTRDHHLWQEIMGKVREAAQALAGCKSMDDFAERLEPIMAQEHLRVGVFSSSARDRMKAADEVTGRRSAKRGRTPPEEKGLFFPIDLFDRMVAMRERELARGEKVIEVPRLPAREPT